MRKLARRFVVAPTPEAYTSKTCCRRLSERGPWAAVEDRRAKKSEHRGCAKQRTAGCLRGSQVPKTACRKFKIT